MGWIQALKQEYRARVACLCDELDQVLPSTVLFTRPQGGYFVWLTCPRDTDIPALRQTARQMKVDFNPGSSFSTAPQPSCSLRLSFAFYGKDALVQGARRLGQAFKQYGI